MQSPVYLKVKARAMRAGKVLCMYSKFSPLCGVLKDKGCCCKTAGGLQVGIHTTLVEDTCNAAEGAALGLACCGWAVTRTCNACCIVSKSCESSQDKHCHCVKGRLQATCQ